MLAGIIDMIYGKPDLAPPPQRVQVKLTEAATLEKSCRELGLLNKFDLEVYRMNGKELHGLEREAQGFNFRLIGWYSSDATDWVELAPNEQLVIVATLKGQ